MSGQPSNVIPLRPDCGPSGRTPDRVWMARIRRGAPLPPPDWAAIDAVLAEMGLQRDDAKIIIASPVLRVVR
jgi:hypothetical protein